MNKLWVRLTLAFSLVTVAGLVMAAILANSQVSLQFRRFLAQDQMHGSALVTELADYYGDHGSWTGVEELLSQVRGPGMMGAGGGMRRGQPGLILADAAGRVVYQRGGASSRGELSRQERLEALPIEWQGRTVGFLVAGMPAMVELTAPAQAFLEQLNRSLLQAGLIAGGLGVLLGLAISRNLSAPLAGLAAAARRISQGEFTQQVPVRGSQEVADLARAFNDMAAALQQAELLRQNMVADVAHELRTPLAVIQGNLQAILDEVYPLEKSEIATIYDETLILSRLINDLRELARAEAGQLSLNIRPLSLAPVVEKAVPLFEGIAQEHDIRLGTALPAYLPPVLADADRVQQVIHNLLANALRYSTPGGEVTLTAESVAGPTGGPAFVRVVVADTGPGITSQDLPHVFDRFWRADHSRSRDQGGSGLGLAIARQLIETQGGQIGVESEGVPGQGSRFWFTLPVSDAAILA